FFQDFGGKRIGAGASAIEQQPRDAILVARQLEILVGPLGRGRPPFEVVLLQHVYDFAVHARSYTVSMSMAPPRPPPMHSVAMPRLVPSRFIAFTRCNTMRLSLVPTGWPR